MCTFSFTFILLIATSFCLAEQENIFSMELTNDDFDVAVQDKNLLVAFYSPKCELAKRFLDSQYEKLAEEINSRDDLKLARVNCDEHAEFCKSQGVNGLAVHLYQPGEERLVFKGVKNMEGLSKFLIKSLGDTLKENIRKIPEKLDALNDLTEETFIDHIASGNHFIKFYAPWCGHCQRLESTWNDLANSLEYDTTVSISRIDCTQNRPICQDFEVKGYPTLLWIVDGKKIEKYSESRSLDAFKAFIEEKLGAEQAEDSQDEEAKVEEIGVLQLTSQSFQHGIERGVTIVKFYAPWCGHCKRMASTWDELAAKYVGNSRVKIAKVDCTLGENKELCNEQEVDGFPTIYIYLNGNKVEEYNGNRSIEDLIEYINRHAERDEL